MSSYRYNLDKTIVLQYHECNRYNQIIKLPINRWEEIAWTLNLCGTNRYDRILLVLTLDKQKMKERILIGEELQIRFRLQGICRCRGAV